MFAVTTPLRKDVELTREYVAQVNAIQHIELRNQERGYLTEIFVDEGQLVEEGTKMFQIMPLLYKAELRRAEAEREFDVTAAHCAWTQQVDEQIERAQRSSSGQRRGWARAHAPIAMPVATAASIALPP